MDIKSFILFLLSCVLVANGQRYFGGHGFRGRTDRIPANCPRRIPCLINPCRTGVHNCPNFPNAVCINDDPCQPHCVGHYYIQRQRRLTTEECHGDPVVCPEGGPRIRCLRNPCQNARCPAYPEAVCINDDPCEPHCVGHFYLEGEQLGPRDCRRGRRRRIRVRQH